MEKRIRIIYSLTIAAIIAFLAMQIYWLHSRYEYSIEEYEARTSQTIIKAVEEYAITRKGKITYEDGYPVHYHTTHSVSLTDGHEDSKRNVLIILRKIVPHKILGITERRNLTDEEDARLNELISDSSIRLDESSFSFDASSAPKDARASEAMGNFEVEHQHPFQSEYLDSLLRKEGIQGNARLVRTDSMIWAPEISRHESTFNPSFTIIIPYSELERKSVAVSVAIPSAKIIGPMGTTLAIVSALSLFLIVCLMLQLTTILRFNRFDKIRNGFVSTMIHELKRPLSTLKLCVSGIENKDMLENPELRAEMLADTRSAIDNLSAYFSKLRDIAYNTSEQVPLSISCFNLASLTEDVIASISIPPDKKVSFSNCIDRSITVSADRTHIFNILSNLIENSVKYSDRSVNIYVNAMTTANSMEIRVCDNGHGIPSGDLTKIFTRFYRGKAADSEQPGMGLGLAYVKLLAEAHGGSVDVESRQGEGSTFVVTLPQ